MATATFADALLPLAGTNEVIRADAPKAGLFTRIVEALAASRRRRAEREIARVEAAYGISLRGDARDTADDLPF